MAIACIALFLWALAPLARADAAADGSGDPSTSSEPPVLDGSTITSQPDGSGSSPDSTTEVDPSTSSDSTSSVDTQQQSSTQDSSSTGASSTEPSTDTQTSPSSTDPLTGSGERPSGSNPQDAAGSPSATGSSPGSTDTFVVGAVQPSGAGPGSPGTSQQAVPPASGPGGATGVDIFDNWADTGGIDLQFASSLPCGQTICHRASPGFFALGGSAKQLQAHGAHDNPSKPSELPQLRDSSGGPGHAPGLNFSLPAGGGGGGGAAFLLLSLIAVLAMLSRVHWTAALTPTATWQPSAYVPPIESPG